MQLGSLAESTEICLLIKVPSGKKVLGGQPTVSGSGCGKMQKKEGPMLKKKWPYVANYKFSGCKYNFCKPRAS